MASYNNGEQYIFQGADHLSDGPAAFTEITGTPVIKTEACAATFRLRRRVGCGGS